MKYICLFIMVLFMISCADKSSSKRNQDDAKLPNIIFYLADDQDVYDYGCYGNDKVNTPAVDRLAKEGMLFENVFTGQAICAPSRSQLLTGKYPLKNGCFANHTGVKPDLLSVTHYMKKLGYEVVLAGKSHVKPATVFKWDREWQAVPMKGVPRAYIPLDSIKNYFENAKNPFCMFITSKYPHGEYFDVPNADANKIKFYPFNESKKTNGDFIKMKAGYYRSIEEDNKQLEKVLEFVDDHLGENTVFVYSSDHGVSGKFSVKDIGLRVPFVVRWPKVIKPGATSDALIHYTDVLPTFIEVAGGTASDDMDGKSFLPILNGETKEINEYVYGVRTNQNILNAAVFPSRMIRNKRYKYIRNFNALEVLKSNLGDKPNVNVFIKMGAEKFGKEPFEELYDIKNDSFEQINLVHRDDYQKIKERLRRDMFLWMQEQGDFLNDSLGNMPIITAKGFQLDQDSRTRTVPDSLKNTLKKEDYYTIDHW